MQYCRLGRIGLRVSRTGFGALPIQRLSMEEAARLLRKAFDAGITLFDTARSYTDSEEKIGRALGDVRDRVILATKSSAKDRTGILRHVETSLGLMKRDVVDIYQLHNPDALPDPNDPNSSYAGLVEARRQGKIRFIGISSHKPKLWREACASGLYDTIQMPLSGISSEEDFHAAEDCGHNGLGILAMKPFCGGLLTNPLTSFAVLRQYDHVVPIWGFQRETELDSVLALEANPPTLDHTILRQIEKDRLELAGEFCRGCGYCLPCPQNIRIPFAARMAYLLRRAPWQSYTTPEWRSQMALIENCENCGECRARCPYNLDTPKLLQKMYADYQAFCREKGL